MAARSQPTRYVQWCAMVPLLNRQTITNLTVATQVGDLKMYCPFAAIAAADASPEARTSKTVFSSSGGVLGSLAPTRCTAALLLRDLPLHVESCVFANMPCPNSAQCGKNSGWSPPR